MSAPTAFRAFEAACQALRPEVFVVLGSGMGPLVVGLVIVAIQHLRQLVALATLQAIQKYSNVNVHNVA